ncbi:MAG: hypothetical protein D8M59_11575 [Planctomycetes bacterium]|nr:hypothetical protein [Planctomycetota bacterium]NOG55401.1 hypothetical protein [Planctomycetota bacterium]
MNAVMKKKTQTVLACLTVAALGASGAWGEIVVDDFEDLAEGFYGIPYSHQGITYHDLNNVSGVFPSGETFDPQPFDECIIEDATYWYNDFPGWGSADKCMTWGTAYINGDNLSLGRCSTVTMDLDRLATSVTMDLGYYENGPWGGIEFHLDALSKGTVVGSDGFVISDLGGRDNGATATLSIAGVEFDQLHFYATYGDEYSMPRAIIDDLTLDYIGGGGATLAIDPDPLVAGRDGSFIVTGATPDAKTYLAYSLSGMGSTYVPFLNVTVDLNRPTQAGDVLTTDGTGACTWVLPVPKAASGRNVWLQAAQFENTTNVVATRVQ